MPKILGSILCAFILFCSNAGKPVHQLTISAETGENVEITITNILEKDNRIIGKFYLENNSKNDITYSNLNLFMTDGIDTARARTDSPASHLADYSNITVNSHKTLNYPLYWQFKKQINVKALKVIYNSHTFNFALD
jgi:hypothetical protein